jgi:hypothetical protein
VDSTPRHFRHQDLGQMRQDSATPSLASGSLGGTQRWRNRLSSALCALDPFALRAKRPSIATKQIHVTSHRG